MQTLEELKHKYEVAQQFADRRFPGTVIAGPANYNSNGHIRAHTRANKHLEKYLAAVKKHEATKRHIQHTTTLTEQMNMIAGDFIANLKIGDIVIGRWTNSNNQYEAQVQIIKINARTVVCALITAPNDYEIGQKWPYPKVGTVGNCLLPL